MTRDTQGQNPRSWRHLIAACSLIFILTFRSGQADDVTPLAQFTGAHTRVVWVQDHGRGANDVLAAGKQLRLMKWDSHDGVGETALLSEFRNYSKPLLAPDGQRVVYSDQFTQKFLVINFDGTGRKTLGDGFAVDVCRDPADGTDWVYVAKRFGKPDVAFYRNVRRVKLDQPKVSQKVWDQTDISCDNFQLSGDLTQAGSGFPWPHGGIADLGKKTWKKLDQGCWASIAPDNSGLGWVLDGPHRHLQFHRPDQAEGWKVEISSADAVHGAEVFHPRWSNHVRFLALTGPYQVQGPINLISGGGPKVEIQIGRFQPDFRAVESWFQLTDNAYPDFYPDVWIEGGETSIIELPGLKNKPVRLVRNEWPTITKSLLYAWSHGSVANQLADSTDRPGHSCKVTPHGPAVFGRSFDLRPRHGTFTLDEIEPTLLKAIHGSGEMSLEMLVTAERLPAKSAVFFQIGSDGQPQLRLSQSGSQLQWQVGREQGHVEVPAWSNSKGPIHDPVHVMLTMSSARLEIFFDGKRASSSAISPKFQSWTLGEVQIGSTDWTGHMEAVALFSRSLAAREIELQALQSQERLRTRKPVPQVRVKVKCLEPSSIPSPKQILPYRRALAFDVCEVLTVEGPNGASKNSPIPSKSGDKILVARWVILDGKTLSTAEFKTGDVATWTLERVTDHPELESERQVIDTAELDLPTWYVVE